MRRQLPYSGRSYCAPAASVSRAGRIARRQLPYSGRSYCAPAASVSRAGRIARRQLPYHAPVVSRADSFNSAAGLLPSESLVALPSSCARRFLLEIGSLSQFHTGGCYSFDCPASPESRRPKCGCVSSPAPTQLALLSPICFTDLKGRELATRRNPR